MFNTTLSDAELNLIPENQQVHSFVFIEPTTKPEEAYHTYFHQSYFIENFEEAKELLKKLDILNQVPQMIVIDQPLDIEKLKSFKAWLKQTFSSPIPIVYHHKGLSKETIKKLFKNNLVEDVTDLSTHYQALPQKASFLKKIAQLPADKTALKNIKQKKSGKKYGWLKRTIDFTLALLAIIVCLPIFILVALAIKIESRGPVFYNSLRAGKGYKVFKFYKFRTMVVDADKKVAEMAKLNQYKQEGNTPAFFKVKNDPRITKLGAFLRNSSLDELPQLFNVLKGDMSFVGNRPLPLYEATSLTTDEWSERFMAPAGITGLWQISKRGKEDMNPLERISLDINYARNRSLAGDMKILLKTPSVLIQKANV
jgi:lipopolysaccharide/colanic/teichoic acid biosynthesis glycosyltransferase